MRFLSSLFGGSEPSASWQPPTLLQAVLDLRERSICGVKLGQPAAELERIGRPANARPFKAQRFEYPEQGMAIDIEQGSISDVRCVIAAEDGERVPGRPCELALPSGARITINESTRWEQIASSLPKPERTDRDEEECVHWVRLGSHWLNVECSPDNRILALEYYID